MGKIESWLDTAVEMLPNFVVALLILTVFYLIGRVTRRAVAGVLRKTTKNKTIISLFETLVGILIAGLGLFIALGVLKLDRAVTSLLAGAGIIGLVLGFAFQDITSNFVAGVILSIRHPFGIGDIISTNGYYGYVIQVNLRNTVIETTQGQIIYIPNKLVFEKPVENLTQSGHRRIDLSCGVSYGDDLAKAQKLAIEAVEELDLCNSDREVQVYYDEFGTSSVNFKVRFWIDFKKNHHFWEARSDAIMAITKKFDEHDIMIPFPIRTLDFGIRGGEKLNAMLNNGNNREASVSQDANSTNTSS